MEATPSSASAGARHRSATTLEGVRRNATVLSAVRTWWQDRGLWFLRTAGMLAAGAVALAGSATHVVRVGAFPEVGVTGWMVWTVAGCLEVVAAIATMELRARSGWNRLVAAVTATLAISFIILANLAASNERSWAAQLPWAEAFGVTPPVVFVLIVILAETSSGPIQADRSRRARPGAGRQSVERPGASVTKRGLTGRGRHPGQDAQAMVRSRSPDREPTPVDGTGSTAGEPPDRPVERSSRTADGVSPGGQGSSMLTVHSGENRSDAVARWVHEGHRWTDMVQAGMSLFDASESTMKREVNKARGKSDAG